MMAKNDLNRCKISFSHISEFQKIVLTCDKMLPE